MSLLRKSLISLCLIGTTFSGTIGLSAPQTQAMEPESKVSQCKRFVYGATDFVSGVQPREGDTGNARRYLARVEAALKQFKSRRFSDPKIRQLHQRSVTIYRTMADSLVSIDQAARRKDVATAQRMLSKMQGMKPAADRIDQEFTAHCGAHIKM